MVNGDTPVGPRLTELQEAYDGVRFYDAYPSVGYLLCRARRNSPHDEPYIHSCILDDRERAERRLKTVKLVDAAEAYNECELHNEEYEETFHWYLKTIGIR
jgi:hypothetical protein